jgi:hypothetical protein
MSSKKLGGLALTLGLVVAVVVAAGVTPWASAIPAPPPPPGATSPPGPKSTFYFNAYGPSPNDDVLLRWDQEALNTIRATRAAPAVAARALAIVHTATYDAWAPYDPIAIGTRLGGSLRRPAAERTLNYKSKAISYAAYRVLLDLFPSQSTNLADFMSKLATTPTTPPPIPPPRRASATSSPGRCWPTATMMDPTSSATSTAAHPTPTGPATPRKTAGTNWSTPTGGSRCACRCHRPAPPAAPAPSSGSPPPSGVG